MSRLLVVVIAGCGLSGCCGYSTRALVPSHLRSVAVVEVQNLTTQPGLADELSDSLSQAFDRDRSLRLASPDRADLAVSAKVTSYSRTAASYEGNQSVTGYELAIGATVEAEDRVRNEVFFSGASSARLLYSPDTTSEETAASRVIATLARDIVRAVVTAW
jgi:hypothetical protein